MDEIDKVEWVARFTRRLMQIRPEMDRFTADRLASEQHRLNGDVWPERACESFAGRMAGSPLDHGNKAAG